MVRTRLVLTCMLLLSIAAAAAAQTGLGSLRGYIKDEQGGALPGATVTATSPALIRPATAVSDAEGYYRLLNLPPGTYDVTVELSGFASYKRADVLVRAGANFQVDAAMKLGTLSETITVSGESPMLEVSKPSNVLNIAANIFNLTNAGNYTQYNYNGANEKFNTANFLQMRNQQPARALQMTLVYRF